MQPRLRNDIAHWLDNSQIEQGTRRRGGHRPTSRRSEAKWSEDVELVHRDQHFVAYAIADLERRRQIEEEFLATFRIDPDVGVVTWTRRRPGRPMGCRATDPAP